MWRRTSTGLAAGWIGIVLLAAGGCTISIQPWTRATPAPAPNGMDSTAPGFFGPGLPGPMPRPGSGPAPPPNNETVVQLIKQFNEADDHRKALLDQVQTLKKKVKDREDSLQLASHEMEVSAGKLKETRTEFRQWETEMQELRDRVRKLEDNRRAVGQLIEEILNHLDRPREPLRLPKLGP